MTRSIKSRLVLLVAAWFTCVLALGAGAAAVTYAWRMRAETGANLELARAAAASFEAYVDGVSEEALAIGLAFSSGQLGHAQEAEVLAAAERSRGSVRRFFWAGPDGIVRAASDGRAEHVSIGDRVYFRQIAAGADVFVSDLLRAKLDGHPVFVIARAVRIGGVLRGLVAAEVDASAVDVMPRLQRVGAGMVALFDGTGRIVATTPSVELPWDERLRVADQDLVARAVAAGESWGGYEGPDGARRIGAAVPIPGRRWVARASRAEAAISGPIRKAGFWFGIGVLLLALAGAAASLVVERWIVRSLDALQRTAEALGRGDARTAIEPRAPIEVVRLAAAFQAMAVEQARASARVEDEQRWLEAVVRTMPVGVMLADARGRIRGINDAAQRIWCGTAAGDRLEDWTAYHGWMADTGRPLETYDWALARALLRGETSTGEIIDIERLDGTRGTILNGAAPIRSGSGAIVGAVAAFQDVTERRQIEAALRRSEADEAILREEARAKNEFLALLSHELRNPLAPIRNGLAILGRVAPDSDEARRAREVLERQVRHLSRLVDDLLDVTRISRGKIHLQRAHIDAGEVIARTVEDHRGLVEAAGLSLHLGIERPLWVDGDVERLEQIVGNLLQNAVKFATRGGNVTVIAAAEDGDAVVRVRDDGAGIAPEVIGQVFEPFVQAERTLERSRGGLGLGLALVKTLVELHGGRVEARSAGVGLGAELTFRIPLAPEVARPADGAPAAARGAASARRVLVIEDNVDAAETLRIMLELSSHEVEVAHDGGEGLEKARAFHPDVVLCDIGLPVRDGYEVARAIRGDASLSGTALVALTGYALPDDVARVASAGFDAHLAKPVAPDRIEDVLARFGARARNLPKAG